MWTSITIMTKFTVVNLKRPCDLKQHAGNKLDRFIKASSLIYSYSRMLLLLLFFVYSSYTDFVGQSKQFFG